MLLENLECTGTEGRLVDCPVTTDDDYGFRYDYTYAYNSFQTPSFCDPLQASYAFVACGTLSDSAEGTPRHLPTPCIFREEVKLACRQCRWCPLLHFLWQLFADVTTVREQLHKHSMQSSWHNPAPAQHCHCWCIPAYDA